MSGFLRKQIRRVLYSARPEVCPDIAAWALERKLPVVTLYPPVVAEVQPYIVGDIAAKAEFLEHKNALERPQTLVAIKNASILDAVGLVQLPGGQICYEGNWWLPYLKEHPAYRRRIFFKRRSLKGDWYSLLCLWSHEYYHWFHDVLPRLETTLPNLPRDTRFLINENPHTYQLASLKAYGITAAQLETQPPGVRTAVERLWFATPHGHSSLGSGAVVSQTAQRLKRHLLFGQASPPAQRIYISRHKAVSRRVVNERELEPMLKDRGFDFFVLEDLSWAEQVKLFSTAEAILGPHGAGLMNMMFAPQNTVINEISASSRTVPCYLVLARQMGFQFQRLHAMQVGDKASADMRLLPERLLQLK